MFIKMYHINTHFSAIVLTAATGSGFKTLDSSFFKDPEQIAIAVYK